MFFLFCISLFCLNNYGTKQQELDNAQGITIMDADCKSSPGFQAFRSLIKIATRPTEQTKTLYQTLELLRLPSELLDHILADFPVLDINDVRLTCRQARMRTFPFWSRTYFSTRQFSEF